MKIGCLDCDRLIRFEVGDDPADGLCDDCRWQRHLKSQAKLGTNAKIYVGNGDTPERFFGATLEDVESVKKRFVGDL